MLLSLLVGYCSFSFVASLLLKSRVGTFISCIMAGSLFTYVSTGFYILRPPRSVYKAFLYAPGFILWKLWVLLVLRNSKKHTSEWVRTSRAGSEHSSVQ